ncbi:MAG: pyridoxine 5'-phosphate synthase [Rhizobiaceae bacterium]|nr:pyridoxine 5'-phosphate synthase [Rhizobiaceae bacterium]
MEGAAVDRRSAFSCCGRNLECHAGDGLTFENVEAVAALPEVIELNIGHFLIGDSIFVGLEASIAEMKKLIAGSRRRER